MLTATEIHQTVFEILTDVAPEVESESDIDPADNLREQVDLDSMDFLNMLTEVSERFEIDIPEKDYAILVSLNDFVEYLSQRQGGE